MSDLINRYDVINMFCSHCDVSKPETCSTIQDGDRWCEAVYVLLNFPSAEPTTEEVWRIAQKVFDSTVTYKEAVDYVKAIEESKDD